MQLSRIRDFEVLRNHFMATRNTYGGCILFFTTDFYEEARHGQHIYKKLFVVVFIYENTLKIVIICKNISLLYFFLPRGTKFQFSGTVVSHLL